MGSMVAGSYSQQSDLPSDMESTTLKLNNGVEMPRIGLGTYLASGQDVTQAVRWAVQRGLRLVDTASIYKNALEIWAALNSLDDTRAQQTFLTSKISPYEQGKASAAAFEGILAQLGRLDLLLIHWPGASRTSPNDERNLQLRHETWRTMEDLYLAGRVRAIGVSNFTVDHLKELLKVARVCPAVNQVEVHPHYQQRELLAFCRDNGITVTAYGSLGSGSQSLLTSWEVQKIAEDTGRSPAQVLLRWGLQKDCAVIPKSVRQERILTFTEGELLTWELEPEQVAALDAMTHVEKYCWDPSGIL